jgi:hypothetical protein
VSVALREHRLLVYLPSAAEYTEGFASTSYAVEASGDADGAWWGTLTWLDPFSLEIGLQQDVGTRAKINFATEVPITEDALVRDVTTGRLLKVSGVNVLTRADSQIVAAEWREDAAYTITDDVPAYTVDTVEVTPDPAAVVAGAETTQKFTATARNADGVEIVGAGVPTWTSSAPAVLFMNATGVGEGLVAGVATVTATIGGVAGTSAVTVEEPA